MAGGLDREELRQLVRDVLRSSLQGEGTAPQPREPANLIEAIRQAILPGQSGAVAVAADDLNQFAREIVQAAGHEDLKVAIMTGRVKFSGRLGGTGEAKPVPTVRGEPFRVDRGMLTEMRVAEIGKQHSKIIVGPEVVVTPLARDRARELKLELVRSKK
jgi:hypothetical protein